MPTKTIAWTTGTGNITLTYTGQGDGTILVSSDDNTGAARSQTITIQTTAGTPVVTRIVTINQDAHVSPLAIPLTFNILGSGTIGWKAQNSSLTKTIQYKKNNGEWTSITSTTSGVTISVASGDVVQFRGDNTAYANSSYYNCFTATCDFTVSGNVMSLINSSTFASLTGFTANYALKGLFYGNTYIQNAEDLILPQNTYSRCYQSMFRGCTNLAKAPVLPATTLATYCYQYMFQGCTSLATAPELPAKTMTTYCYSNMFYGCTGLTTPPELPATTLADNCYYGMFNSCSNLTTAPELPVTSLYTGCYQYMFYNCASLTTAPELPATTLASNCYYGMFGGCSNLTYIKCLAVDKSATGCTTDWVSGVSSTGTFLQSDDAAWGRGNSEIPTNWTRTYTVALLSQYLTFEILSNGTVGWKTADSSLTKTIQYQKNNGSWTSITSSTSGVTVSVSTGDIIRFKGSNTAYGNSNYANSFTTTCNINIRGNSMSLINSSNFSSLTSLSATYTFRGLFTTITTSIDASDLQLPATTLRNYCYRYMFYNCSGLTKAPNLPATTLTTYCYQSMFYGCIALTKAPDLPAATLTTACYNGMFRDCLNLSYIKCLATDISASNCTSNWVNGVGSGGTFVKASTMSSWTTGNAGIPSGWTVQDA